MKKKLLIFTLLICLLIPSIIILPACNNSKENENNSNKSSYSSGLNYKLALDGKGYIVSGIGSCTDSDIVIPLTHNDKEVIAIDENTFKDYTFIRSVKLHDKIVSIGESAFYNCLGLTKIEIPQNILYIGDKAFWGCSNVSELTYSAKNIADENFGTWVFSGVDQNLTDVQLIFTDSVTRIPKSFCNNFNLVPSFTSIVFGNNIKEIGDSAFSNCRKVMAISLPNNLETIGESAFWFLPITAICIPSSVMTIGMYAFQNCINLVDIVIESSSAYNSVVNNTSSYLLYNAQIVKVLKSIVDNVLNQNKFLNDSTNYTKTENGKYYVYTKIV